MAPGRWWRRPPPPITRSSLLLRGSNRAEAAGRRPSPSAIQRPPPCPEASRGRGSAAGTGGRRARNRPCGRVEKNGAMHAAGALCALLNFAAAEGPCAGPPVPSLFPPRAGARPMGGEQTREGGAPSVGCARSIAPRLILEKGGYVNEKGQLGEAGDPGRHARSRSPVTRGRRRGRGAVRERPLRARRVSPALGGRPSATFFTSKRGVWRAASISSFPHPHLLPCGSRILRPLLARVVCGCPEVRPPGRGKAKGGACRDEGAISPSPRAVWPGANAAADIF